METEDQEVHRTKFQIMEFKSASKLHQIQYHPTIFSL